MFTARFTCFPGGITLTTIAALLTACAPAKRISFEEIGAATLSPSLTIKKDIDMVRLEGILPSFEQVDRVYQQTATLFDATMVINDIIIDKSVADAGWLDPVLATVEGVSHIGDFSVIAVDGQMLVGGSVDSAAGAESIASMASDLAGVDLAVTSNLMVLENVGDYQNIDLAGALQSESTETPVLIEQPVAAVAEPVVSDVTNAVRVVVAPAAVSDKPQFAAAANDPLANNPPVSDPLSDELPAVEVTTSTNAIADSDGVTDIEGNCSARPGYLVGVNGCQLLDGFLEDLQFTDQLDGLATGTRHELDEIATVMHGHPDARIAVISYASGDSDIQRATARKRAFLVTSYLQGQGVDKSRLKTFALANQPDVANKIMIREID